MRVEAHAKINWALNITGRLPDGYHALDMVMQSIALSDTLDIAPAQTLSLTVDGAPDPHAEDNLVMRAARALNAAAGTDRGACMALQKRIPARAGLGGGSADCAAALRTLNALWELGFDDAALSADPNVLPLLQDLLQHFVRQVACHCPSHCLILFPETFFQFSVLRFQLLDQFTFFRSHRQIVSPSLAKRTSSRPIARSRARSSASVLCGS